MSKVFWLKLMAFLFVGVGTIGSVLRDRSEFGDSAVLKGFLAVTVALGVVLWVFSKVLEKQTDKDNEEVGE